MGKLESHCACLRKVQKRPGNTLSLLLNLIFSTETVDNNQKMTLNESEIQQTLGKG